MLLDKLPVRQLTKQVLPHFDKLPANTGEKGSRKTAERHSAFCSTKGMYNREHPTRKNSFIKQDIRVIVGQN